MFSLCIFILVLTNIVVHGITVHTCDNTTLTIQCKNQTINILGANYGRTSTQICGSSSRTNCTSNTSLGKVRDQCQYKSDCTIQVSKDEFGDPCPYVYKYLEVNYTCGSFCPAFEELKCLQSCPDEECEFPTRNFRLGPGPVCNVGPCSNRCTCQDGYLRDKKTGKCVSSEYCPQPGCPCVTHEEFSQCGALSQPKCGQLGPARPRSYLVRCVPGYVCKSGYVRDTNNGSKCVEPQYCSTCS